MRHILLAISLLMFFGAYGQRKITPVQDNPAKQMTVERKKATQKLLSSNKVSPSLIFGDSIFEIPDGNPEDTIPKITNVYPLMYGVTAGVDIWDPVMHIFGQKYGLASVSGEISFHNRYMPMMEIGFGSANNTPDGGNFTYKSPLSLFVKIGAGYNFLFNKNPDYMFIGGLRFGWSAFSYDITNIHVSDSYWQETGQFSMTGQKAHALWSEITMGIRVKIYRRISMGWNLRYRIMMKCSNPENSNPWYIPGYGTRNGNLAGSFSVYYTFPMNTRRIGEQ